MVNFLTSIKLVSITYSVMFIRLFQFVVIEIWIFHINTHY